MRFVKVALLAGIALFASMWIAPQDAMASVPVLVTSGAHSVPLFHFIGWIATLGLPLGTAVTLSKPFFQFGIGGLFARPSGGNLATPSSPVRFGTIQDVMVDFTGKNVPLRGQNQFPDDVAPGDKELKGKAAFGKIDVNTYNSLFFGDTILSGSDKIVDAEEHDIPTTTPSAWVADTAYSIGDFVSDGTHIHKAVTAGTSLNPGPPSWNATRGGFTPDGTALVWENVGLHAASIVVTHAADFVADFGVINMADGTAFTSASGAPDPGQYSVTSGAYTFNAADIGKTMGISYSYSSTDGETLEVKNHIMGYGPTFELFLSQPYQGANGMQLFRCRANKMSAPMKRDGYLISDFEFEAYDNGAGKVFRWFQA